MSSAKSHQDKPDDSKSSHQDKKSDDSKSSSPEETLVSAEPGTEAYTKTGGSVAVDTHGVKGPADFAGPHPDLEQPEDAEKKT